MDIKSSYTDNPFIPRPSKDNLWLNAFSEAKSDLRKWLVQT